MGSRFPFETVLVLAIALLACAPPESRFRHTGVVPQTRAFGWDGRTVKAGELRLEGEFHQTTIERNEAPVLHDTALREPTVSVDGVVSLAVVENFELGARVSYAAYAWTTESADGTMPVPGSPSLWGTGPELRWSPALDEAGRVHVGLGANALSYEMPVARWTLDANCGAPATCYNGYRLDSTTTETAWVWNFAVYPSVSFGEEGEYGHVFGGWSAHPSFKNDGFTNEVGSDRGKPQFDTMVHFVGAGYGVEFGGARASAMVYLPLNPDNAIQQGPGLFMTLGGAIPIWSNARRATAPEDAD